MITAASAVLVASLLAAGAPAAQETHPPQPQSTDAPADARFAVLQSETWTTYRLDKATGEVWQLRQSSSRFSGERQVWRAIPPPEDERLSTGVNYQLSASRGDGTLLLNVHTGATWILRTISREPQWVPLTVEK
jgi:hypothetical protein